MASEEQLLERLVDSHDLPQNEEEVEQVNKVSISTSHKRRNKIAIGVLIGVLAVAAVVAAVVATRNNSSSGNNSNSNGVSASPYPSMSASKFAVHPAMQGIKDPIYTRDNQGRLHCSQNFEAHGVNKTYTRLHYDLILRDDILSPDLYNEVKSVVVNNDSITIVLTDSVYAPRWFLFARGFIYVRPEFGYGTVIRKSNDCKVSTDGKNVTFSTSKAKLTDLFENGQITYYSNATVVHNKNWKYELGHSTRRDIWSDIGGFVDTVVNKLGGAANIIKTVATTALTGDFSYDQQVASNTWNLNQYCFSSSDPNLELGCQASFGYTVNLNIQISDYTLQLFEPTITLTPYLSTSFDLNLNPSYSNSGSDNVAQDAFPIASFSLGPISIDVDFTVNIEDYYKINANAQINAQETFTLSGNVELGMSYSPSNGFQWIYNPNLSITDPAPQVSATGTATADLSLVSVFGLSISHLGGVSAAVVFGAESDAVATPLSNTCMLDLQANGAISLALSASITVGDDIGISSLDGSWGPDVVYKTTVPLIDQCLD